MRTHRGGTSAPRRAPYCRQPERCRYTVQLVYFLTGALGVLLLRVVLRLLAMANNQFAQLIGLSNPFVAAFANLFGNPIAVSGGYKCSSCHCGLRWATVGRLIWLVLSRTP